MPIYPFFFAVLAQLSLLGWVSAVRLRSEDTREDSPMKRLHAVLFRIAFMMIVTASAMAQPPVRGPAAPSLPSARRGRAEPCWQVAGVPQSVLAERRVIARQARQEIAAVCANSSLSAAQKQEEIRQIRQREHQQLEGLITPAQREALRACQEQRGHVSHGPVIGRGRGLGPCGEASAIPRHPLDEDEDEDAGEERVPSRGKPPVAAPKPN